MHLLSLVSGAMLLAFMMSFTGTASAQGKGKCNWVGTWTTAMQLVEPNNMPPAPGLSNNSLRQIVRVSIGGKTMRLKLSNEFGKSPVTIKSVQIAASRGAGAIDAATNKELLFAGKPNVEMAVGQTATSDPIAFELKPRTDVAITIYFENVPAEVTGHPGSRTTSYIKAGNDTKATDFSNAVKTDHWYIINTIDVVAPKKAGAVAILGNSITDGRGSTTNMQNRWPDALADKLQANKKTKNVAVLNLGIGGNCVLANCLGPSGVSRYKRDILDQESVRWAIIFEGVNDLGGLPNDPAVAKDKANQLIAAYKDMVDAAHAKNIKVYGATIMPFKNHYYYSEQRDAARNMVNEWIRTSGYFDGVIDFDKLTRDENDQICLQKAYQDDYLHPNAAGHKLMGESVDATLFTK